MQGYFFRNHAVQYSDFLRICLFLPLSLSLSLSLSHALYHSLSATHPPPSDAAWHWLLHEVVLPHMVPVADETVAAVRAEVLRASWAALLAADGNTIANSSSTANATNSNSNTTNANTATNATNSNATNATNATNASSGKAGASSGSDTAKSGSGAAQGGRVFAFFADVFADMCGRDAECAKLLHGVDIEVHTVRDNTSNHGHPRN